MSFITEEGLQQLKRYQYVSGGYSWLDNKMNVFWVWFTELMPLWLAPNAMTVIGFLLMASANIFILYYDLTLTQIIPNWVFLYAAFTNFVYQTLDACDGKQARRTKSSSPLGQLVDHGCDSFSMNFLIIQMVQAVNLTREESLYLLITFQVALFMSNWSEYHTKVLQTHVYNIGVTEVELIIIAFQIITGIYGQQTWQVKNKEWIPAFVLQLLPHNQYVQQVLDWKFYYNIYVVIISLACFLCVALFFKTLYQTKYSKIYAVIQYLPVVYVAYIEYKISYVKELDNQFGLLVLFFALIFSTIVCKIIICSVTEMSFPLLHGELIIPTLFGIILYEFKHYLTAEQIQYLFYFNFAISLFNILRFLRGVINQITKFLGIYCFSLQKRKAD